ncbi:hypothetical protein [Brachybacterium sp. AOP3-A1-3]|uniref:hypothetical protein n=1 Tax=Brachybacterium sp. AOP3-A1-3 TaxID=3457699 RepID=UPI004033D176
MNRNTVLTGLAVGALAFASIGSAALGFGTGRATAPTPKACLIAIDEGDRALDLTSEALGLAGEAVVAAATWDAATLDRINGDLADINDDLGDPDAYLDAKAECRGENR